MKFIKNHMIPIISICTITFIIFILVTFGKIEDIDESQKQTTSIIQTTVINETIIPTETTTSLQYDALQQLYLDIDSNMSYKKMLKLVKSTNLPYSVEKYNGSRCIQVAFTKECTDQTRFRTVSGDYLTISYKYPNDENSANDVLSKYIFGTCAYYPNDSDLELIEHCYGYYFSYFEAGNYINDFGKDLGLDKSMSKEEQLKYYFEHK